VEISTHFNSKQQVFLDFVLSHYISIGVEELEQGKLTPLLKLRCHNSVNDAVADLGYDINEVFTGYRDLYAPIAGAFGFTSGPKYLSATSGSVKEVFLKVTPDFAVDSVQKNSSLESSLKRSNLGQFRRSLFAIPSP
jgi:hypothetical protein